MLDITKLWNTKYLFGPNPIILSRSDYIFFYLAAAIFVLGIVCKILIMRKEQGDPKRYFLNRLFHLGLTIGLLLLLWSSARYENIPWIGTHFVALMLLLIAAVWLGFILWYRIRIYPPQARRFREEKVKEQYLR